MALMNALSKLNINLPSAVTGQRPASQNQNTASTSQQFKSDSFVKSAQVAPALAYRQTAAAAPARQPNQELTFNEQMLANPALIWNTALTPRTEQAIKAFKLGMLGRSVRDMDLRAMNADQVRQELVKRGFTCEKGTIKDMKNGGADAINPRTGKSVLMEIWTHKDGGMVRIKPEGDPTNMFRSQPHLSISVKYPPDASGHDFNNEAFKVDHKGNPMPKWGKDARNPFSVETPAGKKFLDDLADRTHVNLKQV